MAAMAQMSRGALSARPFAPSAPTTRPRPVHLKAAGGEQLWLPGTERPKPPQWRPSWRPRLRPPGENCKLSRSTLRYTSQL